MKKVLITGAEGFLGSHLLNTYREAYSVTGIDVGDTDLLDSEEVSRFLKKNNFDVIIHTANCSQSRIATNSPDLVLANNLNMFFNIARNHGHFGKLIYYGSAAEYGRADMPSRVKEDYFNTSIPYDSYSLSKFVMAQHALPSTNIIELVLFAVFGPGEDWRIRFISNACCRDILNLPITIMQNVFFDYMYIADLVRITEWFVNNTPPAQRYNVCSAKPNDLLTLAKQVRDCSDKGNEIIVEKDGLDKEYSGDNSRLLKIIGDYKFTDMGDAIQELYKWYIDNRNIINKSELSFNTVKK